MASAVKLDIVIPKDHKVELDLPAELPAGPAEVIVLSTTKPAEPQVTASSEGPRSLADLFAGRVGLIDGGDGETLSEGGGEKLADHLEAKRRAGRL